MTKTTREPKPKIIAYSVTMVVDEKEFKFELLKKSDLKSLLEKNSLKGVKVSYTEVLDSIAKI